jgi:hypothetical protein
MTCVWMLSPYLLPLLQYNLCLDAISLFPTIVVHRDV